MKRIVLFSIIITAIIALTFTVNIQLNRSNKVGFNVYALKQAKANAECIHCDTAEDCFCYIDGNTYDGYYCGSILDDGEVYPTN